MCDFPLARNTSILLTDVLGKSVASQVNLVVALSLGEEVLYCGVEHIRHWRRPSMYDLNRGLTLSP